MRSSYHPQIDGKTETVNQCLEDFLICFVHGCPKHWVTWRHLEKFWYNTCPHSSLGTERTSRPVWVLVFNDNDLKGLMHVNENGFKSKGYK